MNFTNVGLLQENYDNSPYLGLKSPKMGPIFAGVPQMIPQTQSFIHHHGMAEGMPRYQGAGPSAQQGGNFQNTKIYEQQFTPQVIQTGYFQGGLPDYSNVAPIGSNYSAVQHIPAISESRIIGPTPYQDISYQEVYQPAVQKSVVYQERPVRVIDTSSRHRSLSPVLSPRSHALHNPSFERFVERRPVERVIPSFIEPEEQRYRFYEPEFYPTAFAPRSYDLESRRQNDYFATPFGLFRNYSLKKNMFSSTVNQSSGNHSRLQSAGSYIRKYNENEPMGNSYQNHGKSDLDEMLDVFKEQLAMEMNLENLKQDLGRQPDFKVADLFMMFDPNQTGQVTLGEFQQGLGQFGIRADFSDVRLLVRRYSRDGNERLSYEEFARLFVPLKYMRGINRESAMRNRQFSYDTKNLISKLLKTHLNTEYSSELIRNDVQSKGIDLRRIFAIIDASQGGLITIDELKRFLERSGFNVSVYEIELLLFRYDRNLSGRLTLQEFVYEFNPAQVISQMNQSPQPRANFTPTGRRNDLEEFLEVTKDHLSMDLTLESFKQDLSRQSDFKLIDLFLLFDDNNTGQVILAEFAQAMESFGLKPDFNEVRLIVKHYSNDGNEKLSFDEFARLFVPLKGLMRGITKEVGAKKKQFSPETRSIITKILRCHLENERKSERIRRDVRSKGLDLKSIFDRIDANQGKILTVDELKRFLDRNGLNVNTSEAEVLLHRYDRNLSGKVNLQEFLYEFSPRM